MLLDSVTRQNPELNVMVLGQGSPNGFLRRAFEAGADDYVSKPFSPREVVARVQALLRRSAGHATSELACGPLLLDTKSARVTINGTAIKLTSLEFRLLS